MYAVDEDAKIMELIKGIVRIEWVELGEGISGDYDPNDQNDIELLRFDVDRKINGEWEEVSDASYCTLFPVDAPEELKKKALEFLMSEIWEEVDSGHSIKRLCQRLSWINPSWIKRQFD
jgi:hypothetical protein